MNAVRVIARANGGEETGQLEAHFNIAQKIRSFDEDTSPLTMHLVILEIMYCDPFCASIVVV